jgi:ElaB/YqjD/DUF883 family membrane-anchored ribosome-binding protein
MNDPILSNDPSSYSHDPAEFEHEDLHHRHNFHDLEGEIRQHPLETIVIAIGVGLLFGVLVRSLQPRRPENRALSLLHELEHRLEDLAKPTMRRASKLTSATADCMQRTSDRVNDLHLERRLRGWGRKLRNYLPG